MLSAYADTLEGVQRNPVGFLRSAAQQRLRSYIRQLRTGYEEPDHVRKLTRYLQDAVTQPDSRLIVTMPPRHGKSLHVSEYLPAWYLGNNPDNRIITASHTGQLANTFSRRVRNLFLHPDNPFDVNVAGDKGAVQAWDLEGHRGGMVAVGVWGTPTGHGANLLIIDDPIKSAQAADSQTVREGVWEWYRETMRTRLEPGGSIIVTATRWHSDDLTGHLLVEQESEGEQWRHLYMPAIGDADVPLWPERWPLGDLLKIQAAVGTRAWQAQYMGRPTQEQGAVLKRAWFPLYTTLPPGVMYLIQSWDTAYKIGIGNDFTVCHTYAVTVYGLYLVHRFRGQVEYPDLVRMAQGLYAEYKPKYVLIEDKASGQSLGQSLRRETRMPVIMVTVPNDMGKMQRVTEATPHFEAGRVMLPSWAPWLEDLLQELTAFPLGAHDDEVDAMTQAVIREFGGGSVGLMVSESYMEAEDG